jgi:sugar diacid utilization regulator
MAERVHEARPHLGTVLIVGFLESETQDMEFQAPTADLELLRQSASLETAALFHRLIGAAVSANGVFGIAKVLQESTGRPVVIEDAVQRVLATSGLDRQSRASDTHWLTRPFPEDGFGAVPTFNVDRWVALARPRNEVLGAINLLVSGEQPTGDDLFKLEQAAAVLGWHLQHNQEVVEAEVALRGDFITELIEDHDSDRARSHAERLGHDLNRPHRAVYVVPSVPVPSDLREIGRRVTARLGIECLATARSSGLVLAISRELDWAELASLLSGECGAEVRMGVGGRYLLGDLHRSLADAEFALKLASFATERTIVVFDELGVWRLLARPDTTDLENLVDHWIGRLIEYDREHHAELLKTLSAYLSEFGVLEATAAKIYVHRNSLKYRLKRISELTGWDLRDPEHRFHLDLACRAWLVRQALEEIPAVAPGTPETNNVREDARGRNRSAKLRPTG